MLIDNLNVVWLIAAILIAVLTLVEWQGLSRWCRFTGILLAVVWLLQVHWHAL